MGGVVRGVVMMVGVVWMVGRLTGTVHHPIHSGRRVKSVSITQANTFLFINCIRESHAFKYNNYHNLCSKQSEVGVALW